MTMSRRVLIGGFKHETNTFSILPTDSNAFRARCLVLGSDIPHVFANTNTEIAGFLDICKANNWTPVPSVVADASPSGQVTRDAFEEIAEALIRDATAGSGVDAVLLQLHGAMVTEHSGDGEGLLLQRLRQALGATVPIGITLDLHANVTAEMVRYTDVVVSYRTYPHVDQRKIAMECAELIARTLSGDIQPVCLVRRSPQLTGLDHGRTTAPGPMLEALDQATSLMQSPGIYSVSILAGFPPADTPDAGPSVVVVADQTNHDAIQAADHIVAHIWTTRHETTVRLENTDNAIAVARAHGRPGHPVVIADFADNPGGGGYGDSTGLLRALIDSELDNIGYGALFDPESALACHRVGLGAQVALRLGGKVDPQFGPPVEVQARVLKLTDGKFRLQGPMQTGIPIDMGPSALIEACGVRIVVASRRYQNYDQMYFKSFGVDPASLAVVAVKSAQHFRAAYADMAAAIVVVDDGNGITSQDLSVRQYRHLRRPIFPLDF